ncbi:MAG: hypothetical protein GY720_24620 [bacterium]|nr:hypothetical protein [bacterium]
MSQDISFVTKKGLNRSQSAVLALTYPLTLIALAIGVGFRQGGGVAEFGASFAAAVMFLVAAPTAWVFAIDFIEAERFTVLLFGSVTSLPLWAIAGAGLATISESWRQWSMRYLALCAVWTTAYVFVIGVIASVVS